MKIVTKVVAAALLCSVLSSCIVVGRRGCRPRCGDVGPAVIAAGLLIHAIEYGFRCR